MRLHSDEEDETAELLRELEKIKKERAEQREREVNFFSRATPQERLGTDFVEGKRKGCRRAGEAGA